MLIVTAVIVAIVTLLFTFSRPTVDLIKEYDFAGTEMTVTVTFANQREIQQKFKEYHEGLDLPMILDETALLFCIRKIKNVWYILCLYVTKGTKVELNF